jgi:hypothetical protein
VVVVSVPVEPLVRVVPFVVPVVVLFVVPVVVPAVVPDVPLVDEDGPCVLVFVFDGRLPVSFDVGGSGGAVVPGSVGPGSVGPGVAVSVVVSGVVVSVVVSGVVVPVGGVAMPGGVTVALWPPRVCVVGFVPGSVDVPSFMAEVAERSIVAQ